MGKKKTQEKYIEEVKAVHGNKYDYSKIKYINNATNVEVKCNKCKNIFHANASGFLSGRGCPTCARLKHRTPKEEVLRRFKDKHGDKYDYSKANITNGSTEIEIICPVHGSFYQTPHNHYHGGCIRCGNDKGGLDRRGKTKEFIKKAKLVYNNKYTYDKTVYVTNSKKVIITCPIHGDFMQRPNSHLRGYGCNKCGIAERTKKATKTQETFLKEAIARHGNKFNYDLVKYINTDTNVTIKCNTCSTVFEQIPKSHLTAKGGCIVCNNKQNGINQRASVEDFIAKAKVKHNNKYDYSKVVYRTNKDDVIVICKKHGEFTVRPDNHLGNLVGCPVCNESKGENKVREFLIKHNINYIREYKIPGYKYRYDFYLPDLNILIEYDGQYHYMPVKWVGGEKTYKKIVKNDKIKNTLAKKNNMYLIRLPYTKLKTLENYLSRRITSIYSYKVENTYYKNLKELCKGLSLSKHTTLNDVRKYSTYKQFTHIK